MTYLLVGLGVALAVTGLVAAFFQQKAKTEALRADDLQKQLSAEVAAHQLHLAEAADTQKRLEAVISFVKDELKKAEDDLARCSTPDAVRARLDGLFPSVPASGGAPAPIPGLPQGTSTKP